MSEKEKTLRICDTLFFGAFFTKINFVDLLVYNLSQMNSRQLLASVTFDIFGHDLRVVVVVRS